QAVFAPADRAPAVGAWSGLTGLASAAGPLVGGLLVGLAPWAWRLVFLINLPLAAVVILASRQIPETRDESAKGRLDLLGAALAAVGLAALIYGLLEGSSFGWDAKTVAAVTVGVVLLVAFVVAESPRFAKHGRTPMMPLRLFGSRQFDAANAVTVLV